MAPIIQAENLTKIYRLGKVDVPALRGVSFMVERGEFVSIVGPSGSGKSTLAMAFLGHIAGGGKVGGGRIPIDGADVLTLAPAAQAQLRGKRIGLVPQNPSMGLSPIMVEKIFEVVRTVSSQGVTVLLVEQNARLALQAAHRGYVMESGLITMSGDAKQMLDDPKVRAAYLGE